MGDWLALNIETISSKMSDLMDAKSKSGSALRVIKSVAKNLLVDKSDTDNTAEQHSNIINSIYMTLDLYLKTKEEFEDALNKAKNQYPKTDLNLNNIQKILNEFTVKWKESGSDNIPESIPFLKSLEMISSKEFLEVVPKSQNFKVEIVREAYNKI